MKLKKTEILVLKKVNKNMESYQGFKYPKKGYVEAKDWEDTSECGGGLHGLEWGCGIFNIESYGKIFLVIKVDKKDGYVNLGDKIKFKKGYVLKATHNSSVAIEYIKKYAPKGVVFNYDFNTDDIAISGYNSIQTAEHHSIQTAGYNSTQTAGYNSQQTAGYNSQQTAGKNSKQTAEYHSTQTAGYKSTQTAGDNSQQTAGNYSQQTAGNCSQQTAGYCSIQTGGDYSIQIAGNDSVQTAGIGTIQIIRYFYNKQLVFSRVITEKEAGKPYLFKDGKWNLINKED